VRFKEILNSLFKDPLSFCSHHSQLRREADNYDKESACVFLGEKINAVKKNSTDRELNTCK
jgi:hypothetical protein